MRHRPRPPACLVVAARYRASRTALILRPDGPVAAVDLATGAAVRLLLLARGAGREAVAERVRRWHELARADCPAVLELAEHDGRVVAVLAPLPAAAVPAAARGSRPPGLRPQAAALGVALDAAGLGFGGAPPTGALGVHGDRLCLLVPALAASVADAPLAAALPALLPIEPAVAPVAAAHPPRRLSRRLPWTRGSWRPSPGRLGLAGAAAACALVGYAAASGSGISAPAAMPEPEPAPAAAAATGHARPAPAATRRPERGPARVQTTGRGQPGPARTAVEPRLAPARQRPQGPKAKRPVRAARPVRPAARGGAARPVVVTAPGAADPARVPAAPAPRPAMAPVPRRAVRTPAGEPGCVAEGLCAW